MMIDSEFRYLVCRAPQWKRGKLLTPTGKLTSRRVYAARIPMGRVDAVLLDKNTALISWMESVGTGARIRLAVVDSSSGKVTSREVAEVSGSRATGFPQLEVIGDQAYMAWNEAGEDGSGIRMIRLDLEQIYP